MTKLLGTLIMATAALCLSSNAVAEILVKDYEAVKKNIPEELEFYLTGFGVGTSWSNVLSEQNGDKPLYCPPSKLALTSKNYMLILEDELKRPEYRESTGIEYVLLQGLRRVFPCPWDKYRQQ
jgi:hypothetical protein